MMIAAKSSRPPGTLLILSFQPSKLLIQATAHRSKRTNWPSPTCLNSPHLGVQGLQQDGFKPVI